MWKGKRAPLFEPAPLIEPLPLFEVLRLVHTCARSPLSIVLTNFHSKLLSLSLSLSPASAASCVRPERVPFEVEIISTLDVREMRAIRETNRILYKKNIFQLLLKSKQLFVYIKDYIQHWKIFIKMNLLTAHLLICLTHCLTHLSAHLFNALKKDFKRRLKKFLTRLIFNALKKDAI